MDRPFYRLQAAVFFSFAVKPASVPLDSGEVVFMYQFGTLGLTNATLRLKGVFQKDGLGGGDEGEARILVLDPANNEIAAASSGSLSYPRFPAWEWHSAILSSREKSLTSV